VRCGVGALNVAAPIFQPATLLEGDAFNRWMVETATLLGELIAIDGFSPLQDNELSAVGTLLAGAARARFPVASEFRVRRRKQEDRRSWKEGRADLWFKANDRAYSFEFKLYNPFARWNKRLWDAIDGAYDDICRVGVEEYDDGFAGIIVPDFGVPIDDQLSEVIDTSPPDYLFQINHEDKIFARILFYRVK
jgi:hypothetical protein